MSHLLLAQSYFHAAVNMDCRGAFDLYLNQLAHFVNYQTFLLCVCVKCMHLLNNGSHFHKHKSH